MRSEAKSSTRVLAMASERSLASLALLVVLVMARLDAATAHLHAIHDSYGSLQAEEGLREEHTWLEVENLGSQVAKSRARRFVPFPSGSKLTATFTLTLPVTGSVVLSSIALETVLTFKLPDDDTLIFGRNYKDSATERISIYSNLESLLNGFGYDGKACTLRTLCEIAESPFQHDLYGELINLVLSASNSPDNSVEYDDYMLAEHYGHTYGDCGAIYPSCPSSVLDIISHFV